ncbi:ribosome biogenesis protein Nop16 [Lipomyces japonicus]|uniref:ribosome biogenesis protein Nop16 n=1 Tax=Lipomyces japonicus TaxID=56871 RepID=UPI0034CEF3C0
MVSVRNRRKQKSSIPKQTRRLKDRQRKVRIKSNAIIAENWDEKLTLTQNYQKLGLTARLSRPSGGVQKEIFSAKKAAATGQSFKPFIETEKDIVTTKAITQAKIIRNPETGDIERIEHVEGGRTEFDDIPTPAPKAASTDVVRQLEELAARGERKVERTQSDRESSWISQLVNKHGDDYEAMFRDKRLNVWQQSVGDLRRRIEKWKKKNSQ